MPVFRRSHQPVIARRSSTGCLQSNRWWRSCATRPAPTATVGVGSPAFPAGFRARKWPWGRVRRWHTSCS